MTLFDYFPKRNTAGKRGVLHQDAASLNAFPLSSKEFYLLGKHRGLASAFWEGTTAEAEIHKALWHLHVTYLHISALLRQK